MGRKHNTDRNSDHEMRGMDSPLVLRHNDKDKLPGPPATPSCRAKPGWRPRSASSVGSRASELPEISETRDCAAFLAPTVRNELAEQILGTRLELVRLILDQVNRSGPEEEAR